MWYWPSDIGSQEADSRPTSSSNRGDSLYMMIGDGRRIYHNLYTDDWDGGDARGRFTHTESQNSSHRQKRGKEKRKGTPALTQGGGRVGRPRPAPTKGPKGR